MGIKDNFSQAVKELWKKDGQDPNGDARKSGAPTELDKYLRDGNEKRSGNNYPVGNENVPLETPYYRPSSPAEESVSAPRQATDGSAGAGGVNQNVQNLQNQQKASVNTDGNAAQASQNDNANAPQGNFTRQDIAQNFGQNNPNNPNRQSAEPEPAPNAYDRADGYDSGRGGYDRNADYDPGRGGYNQNAAMFNRNFQGNYNGGGDFVPPGAGGNMPPKGAPNEVDEITVISKNTVIDGNIRSLANMQIDGNIKGNVETTRNVDMTGKIVGDIVCNNAGMNSAAMQGNVSLKGRMRMDRDTILIGDLSSQYADINGRVRGKLDIVGKAELKRDAIVFGDINASTIAVTDGAIIQGYVNTTFLSKEDSRNVFPDAISIDSKETQ